MGIRHQRLQRMAVLFHAVFPRVLRSENLVMFLHGGGPGKIKTQENVDANCSIGIAWSDDLVTWDWPGKGEDDPGADLHN